MALPLPLTEATTQKSLAALDEVRVDVRTPSRSAVFRYGQHVSAVGRVFTRHNPQTASALLAFTNEAADFWSHEITRILWVVPCAPWAMWVVRISSTPGIVFTSTRCLQRY